MPADQGDQRPDADGEIHRDTCDGPARARVGSRGGADSVYARRGRRFHDAQGLVMPCHRSAISPRHTSRANMPVHLPSRNNLIPVALFALAFGGALGLR